MKTDFLFSGLNLTTVFQKKKRQANVRFMDDAIKSRGVKDFSVETPIGWSSKTPTQLTEFRYFCFSH